MIRKTIMMLAVLLAVGLTSCTKDPDLPTGYFGNYNGGGSSSGTTISGTYNGHDYVDLGLPSGTLWATCNVGASSPEDYGNYFAWGETTPKNTYTEANYTYRDNPSKLPSDHDAATANWGNGWRMPTHEEWLELYNNTTYTWTTQNGVNGGLFTTSNGNSLFLPAAGYRNFSSHPGAGSSGYYWSSSLFTDVPSRAWDLYFYSDNCLMYGRDRHRGPSVRPVRSASQN